MDFVIVGAPKCAAFPYFAHHPPASGATSVADCASRFPQACTPSAPPRSTPCRRTPKADELSAIQALRVSDSPTPVMPQDFRKIAAPASENIEITNPQRDRAAGFPEPAAPDLAMPRRMSVWPVAIHNPNAGRNRDHRRDSAFKTRVRAAVSTSEPHQDSIAIGEHDLNLTARSRSGFFFFRRRLHCDRHRQDRHELLRFGGFDNRTAAAR